MLNDLLARLGSFFLRDASLVLWDLADIGLVAVALYYVLLLIRGTRAVQVGIGLGLVFAIYQVARWLGLVTLYAMLDTLLTSLVLIIVVVFQQDIRRALMRFGRRPLFAPARTALETQVIEEVVRAATSLAQKRIGTPAYPARVRAGQPQRHGWTRALRPQRGCPAPPSFPGAPLAGRGPRGQDYRRVGRAGHRG